MASQVKEVKKYSFNQYSSNPQLYMNKESTEQQYQALTAQAQGDQYSGSTQTSFSASRADQFSRDSNSPFQSQTIERQLDQTLKSSIASSQQSVNTNVSLSYNPVPSSSLPSLSQTGHITPQFSQTSHVTPVSRFGSDQPSFQTQTSLVQPPPPPPPHFFSSDHQSQSSGGLAAAEQIAAPSSFSQSFLPSRFEQSAISTSQGYYQQPPPPPPPTFW